MIETAAEYVALVEEGLLYCPHNVAAPTDLQGGTRRYPGGMHAFIGFRDQDGLVVSVGSDDPSAFVAALRRAADAIEAGSNELPPVTT
jgi:hypothetical protein